MKNLFGTDGIRSKVGQEPLSLETSIRLGKAIALWAQAKYNTKPIMLLAHDTRQSCDFLKNAIKTGLLAHAMTVFDASVLPTPATYNIMHQEPGFDFGIVISASHNPYQDNGIKIMDAKKGKLDLEDEMVISTIFYEQEKNNNLCSYDTLGKDIYWHNAKQQYVSNVISHFPENFLLGNTIVIDCANGATSNVAPEIFEKLGAKIIAIHNTPNGTNINDDCGSVFPKSLQTEVVKQHADIGFAFDGDGDRVTIVSRQGIIKNGDDVLALLSHHTKYTKESAIVGTIMSNQGLDVYLKNHNKQLIRTSVGDKFVAKALQQEKLSLGGEQSGHIIAHDYLSIGDGIFAALRIVETVKQTNNWDLKTFEKFPQVLINVPIRQKKDLNEAHLTHIIETSKAQLNNGRLIVRYSGTEPILRVMVEEFLYDDAQRICIQLSEHLQKELA